MGPHTDIEPKRQVKSRMRYYHHTYSAATFLDLNESSGFLKKNPGPTGLQAQHGGAAAANVYGDLRFGITAEHRRSSEAAKRSCQ